jgi:acetyl/propionyl-CoA carboxylase alpha subunit
MNRSKVRVLVANRGEIAVRIIRACRALGLESVAVFTPEDREAPAAALADYSYPLPEGGYLNADAIFTAAKRSGASAIHPGYGFFAENPKFIRDCEAKGIIFVGPTADAAEALGDKIQCRRLATKVGVPTLAGGDDPAGTTEEVLQQASVTGYPVLVKAAAGGGGRGIRIARNQDELLRAVESASKEGERLFLDGRVFLERYLEGARHIEIQMLADKHGTVVYLGERDCSIQRRRQKIVEEAPGPLTVDIRAQMGQHAVQLAKASGYSGLGTVEYLLAQDGRFYLLEVNTRLQVEHPVTEMITGRDLIADQIRVALGEPLGYTQQDVELRGHSIELRVTAEDPAQNYATSTGVVTSVRWPGGPGVRVDAGIAPKTKVGARFDPLLAKIIVHGATREQAITRAKNALGELQVCGVATNAALLMAILEDQRFVRNNIDTQFLDLFLADAPLRKSGQSQEKDLAIVLAALAHKGLLPRPATATAPRKTRGASSLPMLMVL